jgi:hypothetical protein
MKIRLRQVKQTIRADCIFVPEKGISASHAGTWIEQRNKIIDVTGCFHNSEYKGYGQLEIEK